MDSCLRGSHSLTMEKVLDYYPHRHNDSYIDVWKVHPVQYFVGEAEAVHPEREKTFL